MPRPKKHSQEKTTAKISNKENISSIPAKNSASKNLLSDIIEEELGDNIKKKSKLHQLTFKLTTDYRDAVTELANSRNEPVSEITRRALFAVLNDPSLLDEVEHTEQKYRQSLGPSRHHK